MAHANTSPATTDSINDKRRAELESTIEGHMNVFGHLQQRYPSAWLAACVDRLNSLEASGWFEPVLPRALEFHARHEYKCGHMHVSVGSTLDDAVANGAQECCGQPRTAVIHPDLDAASREARASYRSRANSAIVSALDTLLGDVAHYASLDLASMATSHTNPAATETTAEAASDSISDERRAELESTIEAHMDDFGNLKQRYPDAWLESCVHWLNSLEASGWFEPVLPRGLELYARHEYKCGHMHVSVGRTQGAAAANGAQECCGQPRTAVIQPLRLEAYKVARAAYGARVKAATESAHATLISAVENRAARELAGLDR